MHVDAGKVLPRVIDNLAFNTTYYFAVTAYDSYGGESVNSAEVAYTPVPPPETVSTPFAASGPTNGTAGELYTFTTGGAVSSVGDPVQYQFFWSDGTASGWLSAGTNSASKAWPTPGTYSDIRVQARCATHPSVESPLSGAVAIVIAASPAETVSTPFAPVGPANGVAGAAYTYATGGSVTSAGDPVQYRFTWADGTDSGWLPVGANEATKIWPVPGTYLDVRVEARCSVHPTVVSAPSSPLTVTIEAGAQETVSAPSAPAGPAEGSAGTAYAYSSSGGAVSDAGDAVQYRFHWGDGSASEWIASGPATAWKAWDAPGTYRVQVEASCVLHPTVTALSPEVEIVIGGPESLVFSDDFHDGGKKGDPDWKSYRGTWKVGGQAMSLATPGNRRTLTLARPVSGFDAGRLSFKFQLKRRTRTPNTGLVFSVTGTRRYRYVALGTSRIVIGQVGSTPLEKAGVKSWAVSPLKSREWHQADVSLLPDGTVEVYLDGAVLPIVSHRFNDPVPGAVGFYTRSVPALYDDFAVRDENALY